MKNQLTYDIVQDKDIAIFMEEVLHQQGIDLQVQESKPLYDPILGEIDGMLKYEILIPAEDFSKADAYLTAALQKEGVTGHYLQELSNEELIAAVGHNTNKGRINYLIAKIILERRGITQASSDLMPDTLLAEEKDETANQSRSLPTWSRILLVIASVSGLGILMMGMGGIIMGLFLNRFKIHNTKGEMFFCFDDSAREFGLILSIISALVLCISWFLLLQSSGHFSV